MRKKTSENIAGRFMPGSLEYTTLWLVQSEPGQISSFATLVFTTLVEKTIKCITQNMEKKTLETAGPDKYHLCREDCCSGLLNEAFYSNCDQSDPLPIHCLCAFATHHKGPHILSLNDNQPLYGTIWNLKKKNLCAYPV